MLQNICFEDQGLGGYRVRSSRAGGACWLHTVVQVTAEQAVEIVERLSARQDKED